MKRLFFILPVIFVLLCSNTGAEEIPVREYVRLHVLANSDSEEDQRLKLLIRDEILECARQLLADTCSAEEAYAVLRESADVLEVCARNAAQREGFYGAVRVVTGVFDFPDRQYGDIFVPAGKYRAVRVLLGAAEGQNWWCVIYPTLCAIDEKNEFISERTKIVFYSGIGRWLHSLFGGGK